MEVWAVVFDAANVEELDELYKHAVVFLDDESKIQLNKFYHRVDSVRGLIGRLLPRLLLKEQGVPLAAMTFSKTPAGKPYITSVAQKPIGYNVTHDNSVVAMAFSIGEYLFPDPPAYRIGLDVMLLQLSKRDTFPGFVEIFSEQLTSLERTILLPPPPTPPLSAREQLRRFYLIWTLKEAYTKALGLGMGFDFSRIEYDVPNDVVRIDGVAPLGWRFTRFELRNEVRGDQVEEYVGVVATFVKGSADTECKVAAVSSPEWLKVYDAPQFIRMAMDKLAGA